MIWQQLGASLPKRGNPIARWVGRLAFRGMGWRIEGEFPDRPKMVVALVPHSSNMDFILTVAVLWGLGLRASFLMKHSLFWFPLGGILRNLGGIPVDRRRAGGMVGQMIAVYALRCQRCDRLWWSWTEEEREKLPGYFFAYMRRRNPGIVYPLKTCQHCGQERL